MVTVNLNKVDPNLVEGPAVELAKEIKDGRLPFTPKEVFQDANRNVVPEINFQQQQEADINRNANPENVVMPIMGTTEFLRTQSTDPNLDQFPAEADQGFSELTVQTLGSAQESNNPFLTTTARKAFTSGDAASISRAATVLTKDILEPNEKESSPFEGEMSKQRMLDNLGITENPNIQIGLPGALLTTMTRVYANIDNMQYIKQSDPSSILLESIGKGENATAIANALQKEVAISTGSAMLLRRNKGKKKAVRVISPNQVESEFSEGRSPKDLLAEAMVTLNKQPVMRAFEADVAKTLVRQMNKLSPNKPLREEVTDSEKEMAAELIQLWFNKGYFSFGVTAKGYIVPLNTDNNPVAIINKHGKNNLEKAKLAKEGGEVETNPQAKKSRLDLNADRNKFVSNIDKINELFFNDMRSKTTMQVLADTTPSPMNNTRNKETNELIKRTRNTILPMEGETFSSTFIKEMNMVGHGVNEVAFMFQDAFLNQVISDEYIDSEKGFSTHPLADTFTEGSEEKHRRIVRDRGEEAAFFETTDKLSGVARKHRDLLMPRYTDSLARFGTYSKSPTTQRYFPVPIDINAVNGKGETRTIANFANVDRITLTKADLEPSRLNKLAESIFSSSRTGQAYGLHIQQKLNALPEKDMQLLDYFYALGETLYKTEDVKRKATSKAYAPANVIAFALTNKDIALERSKVINSFVEARKAGTPLGEFSSQPKLIQKLMKEGKGEWQYPITILSEMQFLNNVVLNDGGSHKFTYTFEQDATQSNASLMSLYIGAENEAMILGILNESNGEFKDLRDKIYANVDRDINLALNAEEDNLKNDAFHKFFKVMGDTKGLNPAKIYARGLVVAGLYGKSPIFMWSEAQDMLDKVPGLSGDILHPLYTNADGVLDTDALLKDIASIFVVASNRNMSELNGYQRTMKAVGEIMGVLNVSTEVLGPLGEPLLLAKDNFVPEYIANKDVTQALELRTKELGGGLIRAGYRRIKEDIGASAPTVAAREMIQRGQGIFKGNPYKDYPGRRATQLRNALPVDLIQAGDAAMMTLGVLHASPKGKKPLNIIPIHDAAITTAGSTLKFKNSYENIAMFDLLTLGNSILNQTYEKTLDKFDLQLEDLLLMPQDKRINIGSQTRVEDGRVANYSAVNDFFDELHIRLNSNDFYTPEQLRRTSVQKEKARADQKIKDTLDAAILNGYIPFDSFNAEQAKTLTVTPRQLYNLTKILAEHQGIAPGFEPELIGGEIQEEYVPWDPVVDYKTVTVTIRGRKVIQDIADTRGAFGGFAIDPATNQPLIVEEKYTTLPVDIHMHLRNIEKIDKDSKSLKQKLKDREGSGYNLK
jgi:hypothetical protein